MRAGFWILFWQFSVLLVLAAGPALAEPLPKETCDTIKSEQDTLVAAGIADDMAKGPQWARANLPREKLGQIARYISLEEQLLFQCGLAKLKAVLPPDEEEAAPQAAAAPAAAAPVVPAVPKAKPKPKPKLSEAAAPAAAASEAPVATKPQIRRPKATPAQIETAQPAAAAAVPAPTPAPAKPKIIKPKVDDAYRPPAANPAADPFAKQLAPAR